MAANYKLGFPKHRVEWPVKSYFCKGNPPDSKALKKKTGFSQWLLILFHRCHAEAIWLHHPDKPEGNAMDTHQHTSDTLEHQEFWL
ncbi:MAG: hypothetical protein KDI83_15180 [Gammaproteobacteria bacterium]|nr:hypothetical protein [Gammaproteobacteria bacterium]